MTENYTRVGTAIVNNDSAAYRAAKARREQQKYISSLENRINRLENAVEDLTTCVKHMEDYIKCQHQ